MPDARNEEFFVERIIGKAISSEKSLFRQGDRLKIVVI